MTLAIDAHKLSKCYQLSHQAAGYQTLRETLSGWRPWKTSTKNTEDFWALKDTSFSIKEGERVGLIGRNGAGKSTLLKILSRVTSPTSGTATLYGRMASLLEVNTGFHPELTGRENIFLKGAIHGMTRRDIQRQFDAIVDFSGVENFLDTPVKRYSSGMYVRLAFAVAAHLEPDILVVDEVLAVGDAAFQRKCLSRMDEAAQSGRTVIFVSHNLTAIRSLCTTGILLENGQITEQGSIDNVLHRYMSGLAEVQAERHWEEALAPHNDVFRLRHVRLKDSAGHSISHPVNSQSYTLDITYDVLQEGVCTGVTMAVYMRDGLCLFGSMSNHDTQWHGAKRPVGQYRSHCTLPKDLFQEGGYTIALWLWREGYTSVLHCSEVISFEMMDSGELRGDYFGGNPGLILPRLDWSTEKI